ncbi:unnamed protein product [Pylaiella littoralis]
MTINTTTWMVTERDLRKCTRLTVLILRRRARHIHAVMVQNHRDRALSTRPSPYTHPIARASTGLALGVRSSTITGPAGGEGRRPNRQRTGPSAPALYRTPIR